MKTLKTLQQQMKNEEGFTLIELLIVMSIILILVTLAIPQYNKVKKTTNQTSALASMKAIHAAEIQYNQDYPQQGYSCTLASLGGPATGAPSSQNAQVLDPGLSQGSKAGYIFNITNCTKQTVGSTDMYTGYQVTAVPITVNKTGDLGYCMDENGLVKTDPAGATNCTNSAQ